MEIRVIRLLVILVVLFGAVIAKASELEERKNFLKNSQKIWMLDVLTYCPLDKRKPVISYLTGIKENGAYAFYLKESRSFSRSAMLTFRYFDWFHGNSAKSMLKSIGEQKIIERLNENVLGRLCFFVGWNLHLTGFEISDSKITDSKIMAIDCDAFKEKKFAFLREYGYQSSPELISFITARYEGKRKDDVKKLLKERFGFKVVEHPFIKGKLILDVKDNIQDAIKANVNLIKNNLKELADDYELLLDERPEVFYRLYEDEYCRVYVSTDFDKLIENKDVKEFLTTELYNPQRDMEFFVKVKKSLEYRQDFLKHIIFRPEWAEEFNKYIPSRYACHQHSVNNVTEIDCGPFKVRFSEENYKAFSIEGNFKVQLNRQIAVIANEAGVKVSPYLDLTPAFVKYIVYKAAKYHTFEDINTKQTLIDKVILVTYSLTRLINEGDIQLLNRMIKSYVTEKIKNKR